MQAKLTKLAGLSVQSLSGQPVPMPSLYQPGGAVIYLVRRMGWKLCREEALSLSKLKPELDQRKPPVRLVAIAGEQLGHDQFTTDFWPGELYVDPGKQAVFPLVSAGSSLISGLASYLFGGTVAQASRRADGLGVPGNFEGEGLKLGGLWVVCPERGILLEHQEQNWGDNASGGRAGLGGLTRGAAEKMDEIRAAIAAIGASG